MLERCEPKIPTLPPTQANPLNQVSKMSERKIYHFYLLPLKLMCFWHAVSLLLDVP